MKLIFIVIGLAALSLSANALGPPPQALRRAVPPHIRNDPRFDEVARMQVMDQYMKMRGKALGRNVHPRGMEHSSPPITPPEVQETHHSPSTKHVDEEEPSHQAAPASETKTEKKSDKATETQKEAAKAVAQNTVKSENEKPASAVNEKVAQQKTAKSAAKTAPISDKNEAKEMQQTKTPETLSQETNKPVAASTQVSDNADSSRKETPVKKEIIAETSSDKTEALPAVAETAMQKSAIEQTHEETAATPKNGEGSTKVEQIALPNVESASKEKPLPNALPKTTTKEVEEVAKSVPSPEHGKSAKVEKPMETKSAKETDKVSENNQLEKQVKTGASLEATGKKAEASVEKPSQPEKLIETKVLPKEPQQQKKPKIAAPAQKNVPKETKAQEAGPQEIKASSEQKPLQKETLTQQTSQQKNAGAQALSSPELSAIEEKEKLSENFQGIKVTPETSSSGKTPVNIPKAAEKLDTKKIAVTPLGDSNNAKKTSSAKGRIGKSEQSPSQSVTKEVPAKPQESGLDTEKSSAAENPLQSSKAAIELSVKEDPVGEEHAAAGKTTEQQSNVFSGSRYHASERTEEKKLGGAEEETPLKSAKPEQSIPEEKAVAQNEHGTMGTTPVAMPSACMLNNDRMMCECSAKFYGSEGAFSSMAMCQMELSKKLLRAMQNTPPKKTADAAPPPQTTAVEETKPVKKTSKKEQKTSSTSKMDTVKPLTPQAEKPVATHPKVEPEKLSPIGEKLITVHNQEILSVKKVPQSNKEISQRSSMPSKKIMNKQSDKPQSVEDMQSPQNVEEPSKPRDKKMKKLTSLRAALKMNSHCAYDLDSRTCECQVESSNNTIFKTRKLCEAGLNKALAKLESLKVEEENKKEVKTPQDVSEAHTGQAKSATGGTRCSIDEETLGCTCGLRRSKYGIFQDYEHCMSHLPELVAAVHESKAAGNTPPDAMTLNAMPEAAHEGVKPEEVLIETRCTIDESNTDSCICGVRNSPYPIYNTREYCESKLASLQLRIEMRNKEKLKETAAAEAPVKLVVEEASEKFDVQAAPPVMTRCSINEETMDCMCGVRRSKYPIYVDMATCQAKLDHLQARVMEARENSNAESLILPEKKQTRCAYDLQSGVCECGVATSPTGIWANMETCQRKLKQALRREKEGLKPKIEKQTPKRPDEVASSDDLLFMIKAIKPAADKDASRCSINREFECECGVAHSDFSIHKTLDACLKELHGLLKEAEVYVDQ